MIKVLYAYYLVMGEYKMAFEYLFLMGKSVEMDIVLKLLDALRGYRLSFYQLDNHTIDMYVVSNRTRVPYPNCSYLCNAILECF